MQVCAISPSAHKILLIRIFAVLYFYMKKMFGTEFFQSIFYYRHPALLFFIKKFRCF